MSIPARAQRFFNASMDVFKAFNKSGSTSSVGLCVLHGPPNVVVLADDVVDYVAGKWEGVETVPGPSPESAVPSTGLSHG